MPSKLVMVLLILAGAVLGGGVVGGLLSTAAPVQGSNTDTTSAQPLNIATAPMEETDLRWLPTLSNKATVAVAGTLTRHIKLLPQAGAPFDKASGRVDIFQIKEGVDPGFSGFIKYTVQHFPLLHRTNAYAIYATTPSLGRHRVQMFNAAPSSVTTASFSGLDFPDSPAWFTDDVTMEVYIEADDGFDAPDVGGTLLLRGFSPAP